MFPELLGWKTVFSGLACLATAALLHAEPPRITEQSSGVDTALLAVSAWDEKTAWASGVEGTVVKSTDGGGRWERVAVPGGEGRSFADLQALSADSVVVMAAGSGQDSRIYKTSDGGASWKVVYTNTVDQVFFNSFAFWNADSGLLASDGIDGKLYLLKTEDGGLDWQRVGEKTLPPLESGEFGISASGTTVATAGNSHVWVATAGSKSRVFTSADAGRSWQVYETPIAAGSRTTGIFSIAFRDEQHGVAAGGDSGAREDRGSLAWTSDGGKTWSRAEADVQLVYTICAAHLGATRYLAAGRMGVVYSQDDGQFWSLVVPTVYTAVDYHAESGTGWLVGRQGRVARVEAGPGS